MILAAQRMDHVSEDGIRQLVDAFYTKVRADSELGPIFEHKIKDNWPHHLEKMYAFWSSVMLTTGRYKGNPFAAHLKHPLTPAMFERWLALWGETVDEMFAPEIAVQFRAKAQRIAESLQLGMFFRPGAPSGLPIRRTPPATTP
jgi:hemoglobin